MSDGVKLVALSFTDREECDVSSLQNKISAWWKILTKVCHAPPKWRLCGAWWRACRCVRCRKTPLIIPQPREIAFPFVRAEKAAWLHSIVGLSSRWSPVKRSPPMKHPLRCSGCLCLFCFLFVCLFACVNCCFPCSLQLLFKTVTGLNRAFKLPEPFPANLKLRGASQTCLDKLPPKSGGFSALSPSPSAGRQFQSSPHLNPPVNHLPVHKSPPTPLCTLV